MADITFVVHKDWLDSISGLSVEQQDKIIAEIVRYGTELEPMHTDDPVVQSFVNILKGRIDFSKDKYAAKVEGGTTSGRKKTVDDSAIYELARAGRTSAEIAKILQISKSSVDHSDGWRNRRDEAFSF